MYWKLMLATLATVGTMSAAYAGMQTYDFTATLDVVSSVRDLKNSDSGEGRVAGTTVRKGDIVTGRVSFDDAMPLAPWSTKNPLSGEAGDFPYWGDISLDYHFLRIGQRFSATSGGAISVENNNLNKDIFRLMAGSGRTESSGLILISSDQSTFINGALPRALILSDFDRPMFMANWNRPSDNSAMFAYSMITSLVRVNAVPEPGSAALMLAGVGGAIVAARRKRNPAPQRAA